MKRKNKGFTLIELIVSITIIAVLTVVGVVSYGGASKKARDSRRIADLEKIRIALELYRQDVGSSYPLTDTLSTVLVPKYIQAIPIGPKGESYSSGYFRETNYMYRICTFVEEVGSTTADISGCSGLPAGYVGYYKVKNP